MQASVRASLAGVRHVVVVLSGKGGVGKSLVSASLAVGLSLLGKRAAVLDADIHGSSIPWMLGLEKAQVGIKGDKIVPPETRGVAVMSLELLAEDKEAPLVWRGPLKAKAIIDMLTATEWGERDYLVVDLPPGTGDEPLTIAQALGAKGGYAILVVAPGLLVKHVVAKAERFARELNLKPLGVIANMAYFKCPACGAVHRPLGKLEVGESRVLAEIPLDPELADAIDKGELVEYVASSTSEAAQALRRLAAAVAGAVEAG